MTTTISAMHAIKILIVSGILAVSSIHSVIGVGVEGGYLSGKITTTLTTGSSTGVNFTGYLMRPSVYFGTDLGPIRVTAGPVLTIPFVKYESVPSTWTKSQLNIYRLGGEISARMKITDLIQPFLRFEMGKDSITESISAYPTVTSGPTAGTVDYTQVVELKYSYGSLYFAFAGGLQAMLFPKTFGLLLFGYTTGTSNQITLESFTVNGVTPTNVTNNFSSSTYKAFHINLGVAYEF